MCALTLSVDPPNVLQTQELEFGCWLDCLTLVACTAATSALLCYTGWLSKASLDRIVSKVTQLFARHIS